MSGIRLAKSSLWGLLVGVIAATITVQVWRQQAAPGMRLETPDSTPQVMGTVEDFALTNDRGEVVRRDDLLGEVWVAGFIFTRCAGPCLRIVGQMALLDKELPKTGVRLLCFSVDPDYDTPEVLTRYRETLKADSPRWHFLTGEPEPLYRLIRESFHLAAEPATGKVVPGEEVTHSTRLVVVDRQGRIRGYYEGDDREQVQRLSDTVRSLLEEPPL